MCAGMDPNFASGTVWTGDNLPVLRGMNDACVDLIYPWVRPSTRTGITRLRSVARRPVPASRMSGPPTMWTSTSTASSLTGTWRPTR